MYAITNQFGTQNSLSFEGNLINGKGIRLPKKKFKKVAQIYAQKSKGLPDIVLEGHKVNGEKGHLFHCADMVVGNDQDFMKGSESVLMSKFKAMFNDLPAEKVAKNLVTMAKRGQLMSSVVTAKGHAQSLKIKLANIKRKVAILEQNGKKAQAEQFKALAENIGQKIAALNEQISRDSQKLEKITVTPYFDGWVF